MAGVTQGYDGLVELSHGLLNRVLLALYDAGVFPDHWTAAPEDDVPVAGLTVYFQRPFAEFAGHQGSERIDIRQDFVVRADAWENELAGRWSTSLPITVVTREVDGTPLQFLRCDCSQLSVNDIVVTGDGLGLLALFINVAIHKALVQQVGEVPLAAPLPGVNLRIAMRKSDGQTFLTFFVNLDGRVGPFLDNAEPLVPQDAGQSKPDVAVAIDRSVYMPRIATAMVAAGLVDGTKFKVNKMIDKGTFFDNVLRSITLTSDPKVDMADGCITASGSITADISNAPDVDADFSLKFGAVLSGNKITLSVIDSDIDVDSVIAAVIATVIAGPIGLIVEQAIEAAASSAIEDAVTGQSASFALPVQTVFVDGAAITNAATSKAATAVFVEPAAVSIRSDCLIFKLNFRFQFAAVSHVTPVYYKAHVHSREFHKPGCTFGEKIKMKNLTFYPTPWAAFADGFDGCNNCLPQWNGDGTGELDLTYVGDAALPAGTVPTIAFAFKSKYKYAKFTTAAAGAGALTKTATGFQAVWKRELMAPGVWTATIDLGATTVTHDFGITGGKRNKVQVKPKAA